MPSSSTVSNAVVQRHPSPPLGMVAIAFTVLFCAGLYPVTAFGGKPYFPGPWESAQTIVSFFHLRATAARLCAFFQFGSAVPLGIFTAAIVSRLRFLGVKAARRLYRVVWRLWCGLCHRFQCDRDLDDEPYRHRAGHHAYAGSLFPGLWFGWARLFRAAGSADGRHLCAAPFVSACPAVDSDPWASARGLWRTKLAEL